MGGLEGDSSCSGDGALPALATPNHTPANLPSPTCARLAVIHELVAGHVGVGSAWMGLGSGFGQTGSTGWGQRWGSEDDGGSTLGQGVPEMSKGRCTDKCLWGPSA